jgi:hypothetical protein
MTFFQHLKNLSQLFDFILNSVTNIVANCQPIKMAVLRHGNIPLRQSKMTKNLNFDTFHAIYWWSSNDRIAYFMLLFWNRVSKVSKNPIFDKNRFEIDRRALIGFHFSKVFWKISRKFQKFRVFSKKVDFFWKYFKEFEISPSNLPNQSSIF